MTCFMTFYFRIVILLLISEFVWCTVDTTLEPVNFRESSDYVDPHSLYYDRSSHRIIAEDELQSIDSEITTCRQKFNGICSCANSQSRDIPDELFSRRLINMLLSLANLEKTNGMMIGSVSIEITSSQLEILQSFGLGETTMREVDSIISSIFRADEKNLYSFYLYNIINYLFGFLSMHKETVIIIVIVSSIIWVLSKTNWNILKFFGVSVFTILAASFIITYLKLLQDAEIKNTVKRDQYEQIPIQCKPHMMNTFQKIWHMFDSHEDCQKYYESRMENPYLQVTPAIALTHMLSSFVFYPVGLLGDAISNFVQQATKNLCGPLQMIIQPLMILAVSLLILILIIFKAVGSLQIGLGPFPFFSLTGASRQRSAQESSNNISSKESREAVQLSIADNIPSSSRPCTQEALLNVSNRQLCVTHGTVNQKDDKLQIKNSSTFKKNDELLTKSVTANTESCSCESANMSLQNMDSENKDHIETKGLSAVMDDDNKGVNDNKVIEAMCE